MTLLGHTFHLKTICQVILKHPCWWHSACLWVSSAWKLSSESLPGGLEWTYSKGGRRWSTWQATWQMSELLFLWKMTKALESMPMSAQLLMGSSLWRALRPCPEIIPLYPPSAPPSSIPGASKVLLILSKPEFTFSEFKETVTSHLIWDTIITPGDCKQLVRLELLCCSWTYHIVILERNVWKPALLFLKSWTSLGRSENGKVENLSCVSLSLVVFYDCRHGYWRDLEQFAIIKDSFSRFFLLLFLKIRNYIVQPFT